MIFLQGKPQHKQQMDRFCQLVWRPRPPTLLPEAKLKVRFFSIIIIIYLFIFNIFISLKE